MTHDMDVWRVHKHTPNYYAAALRKQKHTWNLKRHEQSGKAADAFLKQHCLVLSYSKDTGEPVVQFLHWKKEIAASLQIPEERGFTFALCNNAAPSMSNNADMAYHGSVACAMAQGQNLMAVIMPQFSYKKGQLYLANRMVEDIFVLRGLTLDSKWAVTFKEKSDTRDARPLM